MSNVPTLQTLGTIPIPSSSPPNPFNQVLNQAAGNVQANTANTQNAINQPPSFVQNYQPQLSEAFSNTLSGLNSGNVNQLRDTFYNYYEPKTTEQFNEAQQAANNYFGSSGFGNSSSKTLYDIKLQEQLNQQKQQDAERALINAYQLAPQAQTANMQTLQGLGNLSYLPQEQAASLGNSLTNQYLGLLNSNLGYNELAANMQRYNQTAALEAGRLQDAFILANSGQSGTGSGLNVNYPQASQPFVDTNTYYNTGTNTGDTWDGSSVNPYNDPFLQGTVDLYGNKIGQAPEGYQ